MLSHTAQALEHHIQNNDTVSLNDLMRMAGNDSALILIIFLSILNIVLSPLPVNSFILGVPLFLVSCSYMMQQSSADKPRTGFWDKSFSCQSWRPYMARLVPFILKVQNISKPRFETALLLQHRLISGFALSLLALIIFLPIPFANVPGSVGMILLSFGILQRDGLFMIGGYLATVLHIAAIIFFMDALFALLHSFWQG